MNNRIPSPTKIKLSYNNNAAIGSPNSQGNSGSKIQMSPQQEADGKPYRIIEPEKLISLRIESSLTLNSNQIESPSKQEKIFSQFEEDEQITIFDQHPDTFQKFDLQFYVFSKEQRKNRRMKKLNGQQSISKGVSLIDKIVSNQLLEDDVSEKFQFEDEEEENIEEDKGGVETNFIKGDQPPSPSRNKDLASQKEGPHNRSGKSTARLNSLKIEPINSADRQDISSPQISPVRSQTQSKSKVNLVEVPPVFQNKISQAEMRLQNYENGNNHSPIRTNSLNSQQFGGTNSLQTSHSQTLLQIAQSQIQPPTLSQYTFNAQQQPKSHRRIRGPDSSNGYYSKNGDTMMEESEVLNDPAKHQQYLHQMQMQIEKNNELQRKMKQLRFNQDINYQRYLKSPYGAHLNFKTFENFFDVEIKGEKEVTGKTIYKLKKINPNKRTYEQQLMVWQWNQQQQQQNHEDQFHRINEVEEEHILYEGFPQHHNEAPGQRKTADRKVRNTSQPLLANRNIKTADVSHGRRGQSVNQNPFGMTPQSDLEFQPVNQHNFSPQYNQWGNSLSQKVPVDRFMKNKMEEAKLRGQISNFNADMSPQTFMGRRNQQSNNYQSAPHHKSPVENVNVQYNSYTIDLAAIQHQQQQMRNQEDREKGIRQKSIGSRGVNHNFINNNNKINININHNFPPPSDSQMTQSQNDFYDGVLKHQSSNVSNVSSIDYSKKRVPGGINMASRQFNPSSAKSVISSQAPESSRGSIQGTPAFSTRREQEIFAQTQAMGPQRSKFINRSGMLAAHYAGQQMNSNHLPAASKNFIGQVHQTEQSRRPTTQGGTGQGRRLPGVRS